MTAFFVYYRVAERDLQAALNAARDMQADLVVERPDLKTTLWRRPDAKDGEVTLMETYRRSTGIDAALIQHIEAVASVASAAWRRGKRHVEVFERVQ